MAGSDKNTATIYQKLSTIQQTIKVTKDRNNDFAGFKYRSAEDILEALKPLLDQQSVVVVLTDDLVELNGSVYVKGTATMYDNESPSDFIPATAYAREEVSRPKMSEGQLTGAASSYARKYALNGLLLLDDNKDPDSQDNTKKAVAKPVNKPTTKPAAPARPQSVAEGQDDDPLPAIKKEQLARSMRALDMKDNDIHLLITSTLNKETIDTWGDYRKVVSEL